MKIVAKNPKTGMTKVIFDPNARFEKFYFGTKEVLPADLAQREEMIRRIINSKYRSNGKVVSKKQKDDDEKLKTLLMNVGKQLDIAKKNGRINQVELSWSIISRGGSHSGAVIGEKGDAVRYIAIYIDGNLILEPIGQSNNMTYVAIDFEKVKEENPNIKEKYKGLDSYLARNGRKKSLADGVIYGIMHTKNEKNNGYNYEEGDILHILFMITRDKETFAKALKEVKKDYGYSGVKRLFSIYTAMKKKAEYPDITKEEILAEGEMAKESIDTTKKKSKTTNDKGEEPEL